MILSFRKMSPRKKSSQLQILFHPIPEWIPRKTSSISRNWNLITIFNQSIYSTKRGLGRHRLVQRVKQRRCRMLAHTNHCPKLYLSSYQKVQVGFRQEVVWYQHNSFKIKGINYLLKKWRIIFSVFKNKNKFIKSKHVNWVNNANGVFGLNFKENLSQIVVFWKIKRETKSAINKSISRSSKYQSSTQSRGNQKWAEMRASLQNHQIQNKTKTWQ